MSEELNVSQNTSRSTRWLTILIFIVPILTACFALIVVMQIFSDEVWFAPGNPDEFDPIAFYSDVSGYAGDTAVFTGMFIQFIQRDGTLDLNAAYEPPPLVRYNFYRPTRDNNGPTGTSTEDAIWHRIVQVTISQPFQWRTVTSVSNDGVSMAVNLGMDRDRGIEQLAPVPETAPIPNCNLVAFWDIALADTTIPDDAVATIIYDATGYRFTIQGTPLNLVFDTQCNQVN